MSFYLRWSTFPRPSVTIQPQRTRDSVTAGERGKGGGGGKREVEFHLEGLGERDIKREIEKGGHFSETKRRREKESEESERERGAYKRGRVRYRNTGSCVGTGL